MAGVQISSQTIDPREVLLFKEMSSTWWDEKSVTVGLRNQNHLRVPFIRDSLAEAVSIQEKNANSSKPLQGLMILDVGCGGGFLTEELANLGCTVVGIDVCPEMITTAKAHAALNPSLTNLSYRYEDNYEKYDAVIALEVLDHVKEPEVFLQECAKCLKPGGSFFVSTFNRTVISWFLSVILAEYVFRVIPRGSHHWSKFATPTETVKMLENCKCQKKSIRGMVFNNFSQHWKWTWFHLFSYIIHAVKETK